MKLISKINEQKQTRWKIVSLSCIFLLSILSTASLIFTPTMAATSVTLYSESIDGFITGDALGGTAVGLTSNIAVGDNTINEGLRGFVSFDITGLPANAIITSATLSLYQYNVAGTPYSAFTTNAIGVDHVDYGSSLDIGDFIPPPPSLHGGIGVLSPSTVTYEWKTLSVTNYVQDDLNNARTRTQYRLYFGSFTDGNNDDDIAAFESSENWGTTGNIPMLEVTYNLPGPEPTEPEPGEAVGGNVVPISKVAVLMPYLTLAGLITIVTAVIVKRKHKD
ncbi:hypothetical protein A3K80_09030 [Candidatus Bathyarchaeota archaeon RBG_13_38_9]|nr:MAG: hypothetical protein A3K80_09030 [Candidatus Bathyarchaeota archaeon RBG_13_38_9]